MTLTTPKMFKGATTLITCFAFVLYAPSQLSSAASPAAFELKSASQYRAEASRYDAAIRAISGITTMKLETEDDLKSAIAILDRERPNLRFHRSKLVSLAINDSTFSSAVKKKSPDLKAAEAFLKELSADRTLVLKLDGAEALKTRFLRSDGSEAGILKRAGERLKEAADRIKQKTRVAHARATQKVEVNYLEGREALHPDLEPSALTPNLQVVTEVIAVIFIAVIAIEVVVYGAIIVKNVSTEEGRDEIAECQERADGRYLRCISDANVFQRAICYGSWLADQATCLVDPGAVR